MNIVLQYWDKRILPPLVYESKRAMKKCAEAWGAEYRMVPGSPQGRSWAPPLQKLHMLDSVWDDYDYVAVFDTDMFPTERALEENFFDVGGIGVGDASNRIVHERLIKFSDRGNRYAGTGHRGIPFWGGSVWKLSKYHRETFRRGLDSVLLRTFCTHFYDEGVMHNLAKRIGFEDPAYLPDSWSTPHYKDLSRAHAVHIRPHNKGFDGNKREKRPKIETYRELKAKGLVI